MTAIFAASDAALWAIPLASIVIALAALLYTAIGVNRAADAKHVAHLEQELADTRKQVDLAEQRLKACEDDRERLHRQLEDMRKREVELLRLVVNIEGRGA